MSKRRFGVEIEHFFPSQSVCERGCWRCDEDEDGYGVGACADYLTKHKLAHWTNNIHCDGSGVEINSPILQGAKGFNELRRVMKLLTKAGAYCTEEDGMHVHHEAIEYVGNKPLVRDLLHAWEDNYESIATWVAKHRHGDYWACARFNKEEVDRYLNVGRERYNNRTGRYERVETPGTSTTHLYHTGWAVNPGALNEHGTIEIRMHHGTLDPDEAEAWIKFGQAFLDAVKEGRKINCKNPSELLNKVKATPKAKRVLNLKAIQAARAALGVEAAVREQEA